MNDGESLELKYSINEIPSQLNESEKIIIEKHSIGFYSWLRFFERGIVILVPVWSRMYLN